MAPQSVMFESILSIGIFKIKKYASWGICIYYKAQSLGIISLKKTAKKPPEVPDEITLEAAYQRKMLVDIIYRGVVEIC